jgi:uncharacterized damage-inducible protein DinB
MKTLSTLFLLSFSIYAFAQENALPYHDLPTASESFMAGSVAARFIDGLGFRFYWATEGLRGSDLEYKPSKEARTMEETIVHIYEMSLLIANASRKLPNLPGQDKKLSFTDMRKVTLQNFKIAADVIRPMDGQQVAGLKVIFKQNGKTEEYPYWNLINGPIEDCIWHTGQLVSLRRASGNPILEKINFFMGTVDK